MGPAPCVFSLDRMKMRSGCWAASGRAASSRARAARLAIERVRIYGVLSGDHDELEAVEQVRLGAVAGGNRHVSVPENLAGLGIEGAETGGAIVAEEESACGGEQALRSASFV